MLLLLFMLPVLTLFLVKILLAMHFVAFCSFFYQNLHFLKPNLSFSPNGICSRQHDMHMLLLDISLYVSMEFPLTAKVNLRSF